MARSEIARPAAKRCPDANGQLGAFVSSATADRTDYLVPVMTPHQRARFYGLVSIWLVSVANFWWWWFHSVGIVGIGTYLANMVVLGWFMMVPAYYFFFVTRMRRPNPQLPLPRDMRVAMVVTKAPSEPWPIVAGTLEAMLAQTVPHDTWLADEDPTEETRDWCQRRGVLVSTRKDVPEYHRDTWPRRSRCKEGNLAYFYDHWGYDNYAYVVQLDADHRPGPNYLKEMIRPFANPAVGYVSAPSVCDANFDRSWAVRGRLFADAPIHGALQAGYSAGFSPLCIGSHYAVRIRALKEIGGLGPELAEDHSTTFLMSAHGWKGVHAFDAEARGEGPASFADCVVQEFQWAKSVTRILLTLTPKYFGRLPARLQLQFAFCQAWYLLLAAMMLMTVMIPMVAVLTGVPWVRTIYLAFLAHTLPILVSMTLVLAWQRRQGWFRPLGAQLLSWEAAMFFFSRWPWVLLGVKVAVVEVLSGRATGFRVTPKGDNANGSLPVRLLLPYVIVVTASALPVILVQLRPAVYGYAFLAILNSLIYSLLSLGIVARHMIENREGSNRMARDKPSCRPWFLAMALLGLTTLASVKVGARGLEGVTWGARSSFAVFSDGSSRGVKLGVYDLNGAFASASNISIQHYFIDWASYDRDELLRQLDEAADRNRWPLVTVEPFPLDDEPAARQRLLHDIADGRYDQVITRLCEDLSAFGRPLFLRWGHEMENVTGRYPWAQEDHVGYVRAYRHFVDKSRPLLPEVYYVWSPVGSAGLEWYWPGSEYVDFVGVSVFGFPEYDIARDGRVRSFVEIFTDRYKRVNKFGKSLMIAEMGVTGGAEHQERWLREARKAFSKYPWLKYVIYFNAKDSEGAWPAEYKVPDWRITPELLEWRPAQRPKRRPAAP